MSLIKDGLAKAWASDLTTRTGFPFFPHRHDGFTEPPFGVVVVKRLQPTVPGADVHLAEVRVVVASDIAETSAATVQARAGLVFAAIEATPRLGEDLVNGVRLCGFTLEAVETTSGASEDGKNIHSDVFTITAGVAGV